MRDESRGCVQAAVDVLPGFDCIDFAHIPRVGARRSGCMRSRAWSRMRSMSGFRETPDVVVSE